MHPSWSDALKGLVVLIAICVILVGLASCDPESLLRIQ
jgi:hypothetical protein